MKFRKQISDFTGRNLQTKKLREQKILSTQIP